MIKKIVIDGDGAIFGRLCSFAAKKALEGNDIVIVNSEKTIITGNKKNIIEEYSDVRKKGQSHSLKGPKLSRITYKMLKRSIRGMLPNFRSGWGREAYKRIICYDGIPENLRNEKMVKINTMAKLKYIELKELSELI